MWSAVLPAEQVERRFPRVSRPTRGGAQPRSGVTSTITTQANVSAREFSVELVGPDDDLALRQLLASDSVPGRVVLTSQREPSYFLGCGTFGRFHQVGVVRHGPSGELVGMACRAAQPRFVNGQVEQVGYITDLQVTPRFRGTWVYPRLLRFLHQLHDDGRVGGYLIVIAAENLTTTRGVLANLPRRYVPVVREVERLWTLALVLRAPRPIPPSDCEIRPGTAADLPEIVACLRSYGAARQFYPAYTEDDFSPGSSTTLGFRVEDFLLAFRHGKLAGVVGLWDRSGSKQTVVDAYHRPYDRLRPLYGLGARLIGAQPLPAPGQRVNCAYASFIAVPASDPSLFRLLLQHLRGMAAERGYAYLMVGLMERDPLLPVARRFLHLAHESRLYSVEYGEQGGFHERLDDRVPHLELAAL